jgi:hypothetical protein
MNPIHIEILLVGLFQRRMPIPEAEDKYEALSVEEAEFFLLNLQHCAAHGDWEGDFALYQQYKAELEAYFAKEMNTSAIEDNLRKERDRLGDLLDKHGVCTECGDMFEHHEDEPLASCSCQTAEWANGFTPYMSLQKALRVARDAEQCQAEKVDELEFTVQELKEQISEMKRNASAAISMLQEIE